MNANIAKAAGAYLVSEGGKRRRISAKKLVLTFTDGAELEVELRETKLKRDAILLSSRRRIVVALGGANVLEVSLGDADMFQGPAIR